MQVNDWTFELKVVYMASGPDLSTVTPVCQQDLRLS